MFSGEDRGGKGTLALRAGVLALGVMIAVWLIALVLGALGFGGLPLLDFGGTKKPAPPAVRKPAPSKHHLQKHHLSTATSTARALPGIGAATGRRSTTQAGGGASPGASAPAGGGGATGGTGSSGSGGGSGSGSSGNGRGKPTEPATGGRGVPAVTPNGKHVPGSLTGKGNGHLKSK
ncbi:MAG: hypothetical protein QOJ38_1701 [Solirubrobacterales bacterium]|nr:hypothetical protein [Solirubrobacterales bacterium]